MKTLLLLSLAMGASIAAGAQRKNGPLFFLSTQKKRVKVLMEAADFRPGQKVADVGTGNGWFAAVLGIYTDSLDFTLQEIDCAAVDEAGVRGAVAAYEGARGRPFTNRYHWVVGTETSTTLAAATFDRLLLLDVYHHMSFPAEMIADLYSILKPGGRLVVLEPVARRDGEIYKGCRSAIFTPSTIASSFIRQGFRHTRTLKTVKSTRKRVRLFVFVKPETPSAAGRHRSQGTTGVEKVIRFSMSAQDRHAPPSVTRS